MSRRAKVFAHGTPNRYWRGCRCEPCTRAASAYAKEHPDDGTHPTPVHKRIRGELAFERICTGQRVELASTPYGDSSIRAGDQGVVVRKGWPEWGRFVDVVWDRGMQVAIFPDLGDVLSRPRLLEVSA